VRLWRRTPVSAVRGRCPNRYLSAFGGDDGALFTKEQKYSIIKF